MIGPLGNQPGRLSCQRPATHPHWQSLAEVFAAATVTSLRPGDSAATSLGGHDGAESLMLTLWSVFLHRDKVLSPNVLTSGPCAVSHDSVRVKKVSFMSSRDSLAYLPTTHTAVLTAHKIHLASLPVPPCGSGFRASASRKWKHRNTSKAAA